MYNIIDNVYLFTCIMGKFHNIAAGVMITWAILGLGKEAVSQTTGNSNGKANVGQVQDSTKKAIVDIDSLDHETIIHMTLDEILDKYWDTEWSILIRKHTIIEINNLRAKYGASPLIEIFELDVAAQLHAQWMDATGILSHTGENKSDPTIRGKKAWFTWFISGENVWKVGEKGKRTIYDIILNQMNSPRHFANLIEKDHRWVWFGVCGPYYVVILWQ